MLADFTRLPTRCKFLAFMPQWDFLDFLAEPGQALSRLSFDDECGESKTFGRATAMWSVSAPRPGGADRHRQRDWSSAPTGGSRPCAREGRTRGRAAGRADGRSVVPLAEACQRSGQYPRPGHARPADGDDRSRFVLAVWLPDPQGCARRVEAAGTRRRSDTTLCSVEPFLVDRVGEITDWNQVKLLTVEVDRLREWYRPGLLCIGDAAHAMSPMGGVGINLAIQDAVAAANLLAGPLSRGAGRGVGSRARAAASRLSCARHPGRAGVRAESPDRAACSTLTRSRSRGRRAW